MMGAGSYLLFVPMWNVYQLQSLSADIQAQCKMVPVMKCIGPTELKQIPLNTPRYRRILENYLRQSLLYCLVMVEKWDIQPSEQNDNV